MEHVSSCVRAVQPFCTMLIIKNSDELIVESTNDSNESAQTEFRLQLEWIASDSVEWIVHTLSQVLRTFPGGCLILLKGFGRIAKLVKNRFSIEFKNKYRKLNCAFSCRPSVDKFHEICLATPLSKSNWYSFHPKNWLSLELFPNSNYLRSFNIS